MCARVWARTRAKPAEATTGLTHDVRHGLVVCCCVCLLAGVCRACGGVMGCPVCLLARAAVLVMVGVGVGYFIGPSLGLHWAFPFLS